MNLDKNIRDLLTEIEQIYNQDRKAEALHVLKIYAKEIMSVLGLYEFRTYGNYEKASKILQAAIDLDRTDYRYHNYMAHISDQAGQFENALQSIFKALKYSYERDSKIFYNAGVILSNLNRDEESIEMHRRASLLDPNDYINKYNMGCGLLKVGEYEEGWNCCEGRFFAYDKIKTFMKRFDAPLWDGSDLKGRKLCVFNEQGMGDFIQLSRFLKYIKGDFFVEIQEPIVDIFKNKYNVVPRPVFNYSSIGPKCDVCVSICSLAHMFGIKTKEQIECEPYIEMPEVEKSNRIAVCWAGNHEHDHDHMRSMLALELIPLNCQFISLQRVDAAVRKWNYNWVNVDMGKEYLDIVEPPINSFTDLSKIIAGSDLVLTIDTGVAHLCGAMGKKTYLMLPKICDYRWGASGDRSVWYPSIKIFRQKKYKDWSTVINEIKQDKDFIAIKKDSRIKTGVA